MSPMLKRVWIALFLLAALPSLSGCLAVVVGGAAAGTAHDRRPAGVVISDRNIQLTAYDAINHHKELVRKDNSVKIVVHNGVMLLIGQVRSEDLRQLALTTVSTIEGVKRVVNEVEVTNEPEGFWRRREDNTLTIRVKTALLDITSMPGFDPSRVNVTTSHHVVYLMGLVSHEEADAVAEIARDVGGVEKVVKVLEYTD